MLYNQVTQLRDVLGVKACASPADAAAVGKELLNTEKLLDLEGHGVSTVTQFLSHEPNFFMHKHRILNAKEYATVKSHLIAKCSNPVVPGHELFRDYVKQHAIFPTGCRRLDAELLSGGVSTGNITELCGPADAGKTQLCLTLCATVSAGSGQHPVAYVDTKGDFTASRLCQLVTSAVYHSPDQSGVEVEGEGGGSLPSDVERVRSALARVRVFSCVTAPQLLAVLQRLLHLMKASDEAPPPKLLIIDSITSPLAPLITATSAEGHGMMHQVVQLLKLLADDYHLAIVVTNHLSTIITADEDAPTTTAVAAAPAVSGIGSRRRKPSLGTSWQFVPAVRLWLEPDSARAEAGEGGARVVTLVKSNQQATGKSVSVQITEAGVE